MSMEGKVDIAGFVMKAARAPGEWGVLVLVLVLFCCLRGAKPSMMFAFWIL